ncbi:MAG: hypothetical protein COA33_001290 [Fluviicola sp.]|nr:hypothetical protein [Fluviicola sp.]
MTKKDFFRILIKFFGLYLITQLVYSFISGISYLFLYLDDLFYLISFISPIVLSGFIAWVLIFKTDQIIKILRLTKNYDSAEIKLGNVNSSAFIKIGLVIIASFLLFTSIAPFLRNTILSFKASIQKDNMLDEFLTTFDLIKVDYIEWIVSGINIVLGYLILTNFDRISKWFFKEKVEVKKNEIDQF